jgi:quercetin dioxygenase-like cupin family protein
VVLAGAACAEAARPAATADPLHTDGDKYHLVLEAPLVRVLRYHDEPGDKTRPHHHPCFVMYALAPFTRELTFPDGSHRTRTFRAGEALWMPAQSHAGRNVGGTPTEALLVELKTPCPEPPA